ncbi:uncharacterized protein BJ171DRAFT_470928 [Polychytrium aggregatum]|uniref:uncharacterized protein n=1 Tax=Polychytrium aggregatum TaxID=110093 RepID=UPI0022FEE36A|nr:uncharacterized protein BJ171DRAFT_470928 [Polychytrium aggregatum]KAI9209253.1 hypothetical protein BJ171DRAFT_470928 [Polychytrium aggregatum]
MSADTECMAFNLDWCRCGKRTAEDELYCSVECFQDDLEANKSVERLSEDCILKLSSGARSSSPRRLSLSSSDRRALAMLQGPPAPPLGNTLSGARPGRRSLSRRRSMCRSASESALSPPPSSAKSAALRVKTSAAVRAKTVAASGLVSTISAPALVTPPPSEKGAAAGATATAAAAVTAATKATLVPSPHLAHPLHPICDCGPQDLFRHPNSHLHHFHHQFHSGSSGNANADCNGNNGSTNRNGNTSGHGNGSNNNLRRRGPPSPHACAKHPILGWLSTFFHEH